MKAVLECREAVQKYFSAADYVSQDTAAVSAVAKAAVDASFWRQLLCIQWFAARSERLRSWGLGCPCHGEDLLQGKRQLCVLKSRRLKEASSRVDATLEAWSIHGPQLGDVECDAAMLHDASAALGVGMGYIRVKLQWLKELPYAIAGAEDRIVAQRCIQLYDTQVNDPALEPWVHRVAHHYLSPSSALGAAFRQHADGGPMSDMLARELGMLSMVPLTEQPAEALHRDISRCFQVAAHAQVPWAAGTLRLEQNIADVEAAPGGAKNEEFREAWHHWKSLMKSGSPHVKKVQQSQRVGRTHYLKSAYRYGQQCLKDWSHVEALGPLPPAALPAASVLTTQIMADYVKALFQKLGVYTVPCIKDITPAQRHQLITRGADAAALAEPLAAARLTCFRVVDTNPGQKRVLRQQLIAERLRKASAPQGGSSSVEMLVQFMELCPGDGPGLQCFYFKAPERIDMMKLAAFQVIKTCAKKWQPAVHSGPSGCLCFDNCQLALPEHGLQDQEAPVLILLEALHKAGWRKGRENTPHLKDDDSSLRMLYCIQNCIRRKLYFHCLLRLEDLFEKGLAALPCLEMPSYYKCLLLGLANGALPAVLPGRPAKEYKALLAASRTTASQGSGLAALGDDDDHGGSGCEDIVMAEAVAPSGKPRRRLHYAPLLQPIVFAWHW
jgi:hypothetical protein